MLVWLLPIMSETLAVKAEVRSGTKGHPHGEISAARCVIAGALAYWALTWFWFWRYCGHNINIDAISYIGIARHIVDHNFAASLHGYWSPLVSWLIAATSVAGHDYTLNARLLMIPAFAGCLALVHRLTSKLWGSPLLAALAVLWYTVARGIAAFSLYFIGADLILTAFVLLYFVLLLRCLESPHELNNWLWLGSVHAVAFFAKAIAMPLLALSTTLAAIWIFRRAPRQAVRSLAVAALIPVLCWVGWGLALKQKYGVFTTGYQLHWNLLDSNLRAAEARRAGFSLLRDDRPVFDRYMVSESMPPGSAYWHMSVLTPGLLRQITVKEVANIPQACKEILVLVTPGGVFALFLCLFQLTRFREREEARFRFSSIVVITTAALIFAYSMLVFDGRYVIPLASVLICLGIRFVVPEQWVEQTAGRTQSIGFNNSIQSVIGSLVLLGLIGVQVYRSSPWRSIRQDFQSSTYEASNILERAHANTVVLIGQGPYPEHGLGWEAGIYSAYFSGTRIVGDMENVPRLDQLPSLVEDMRQLNPDAVMIWDSEADAAYSAALEKLEQMYPQSTIVPIRDPKRGVVGSILARPTP